MTVPARRRLPGWWRGAMLLAHAHLAALAAVVGADVTRHLSDGNHVTKDPRFAQPVRRAAAEDHAGNDFCSHYDRRMGDLAT